MASVAFHQFNQFKADGKVKLFGDYGGYAPGGQKRDFVFIDDVVAINLWFLDNPCKSGIFNLGTGRVQPFNVYGPREQHKGRMASVAFHQFNQFKADGKVKLFGDYGGYAPGGQKRDFVFIDDVVAVNLWFLDNPGKSGIFNLGTGRAQPFNDVAITVVNTLRKAGHVEPLSLEEAAYGSLIDYISFPAALVGKYQSYTQADLSALRHAGCDHVFADVQTGVAAYMQWLMAQKG